MATSATLRSQSNVSVPRLRLEKIGLKPEQRPSTTTAIDPAASPSVLPSASNPMIRAGGVPLSKTPSRASVTASTWVRSRSDSGIGIAVSQEQVDKDKPKEGDAREIIALLRTQLVAAGARTAIELAALISAKALVGKDIVDPATAMHVLRSNRFRLTEPQSTALFAAYSDGPRVLLTPLVRDILGSLPDRRAASLGLVFDKLDADHDGVLTASDLRRALRIAHHPLVVTGQTTLDQAHTGFLARALDPKAGGTTKHQFNEYHVALSLAFRRDEEFAGWLQKFWRPS